LKRKFGRILDGSSLVKSTHAIREATVRCLKYKHASIVINICLLTSAVQDLERAEGNLLSVEVC
jgi:hypothetical protein